MVKVRAPSTLPPAPPRGSSPALLPWAQSLLTHRGSYGPQCPDHHHGRHAPSIATLYLPPPHDGRCGTSRRSSVCRRWRDTPTTWPPSVATPSCPSSCLAPRTGPSRSGHALRLYKWRTRPPEPHASAAPCACGLSGHGAGSAQVSEEVLRGTGGGGKPASQLSARRHATTYRLENTLTYAYERCWSIAALKGTNNVAIGYDEGTICIQAPPRSRPCPTCRDAIPAVAALAPLRACAPQAWCHVAPPLWGPAVAHRMCTDGQ